MLAISVLVIYKTRIQSAIILLYMGSARDKIILQLKKQSQHIGDPDLRYRYCFGVTMSLVAIYLLVLCIYEFENVI